MAEKKTKKTERDPGRGDRRGGHGDGGRCAVRRRGRADGVDRGHGRRCRRGRARPAEEPAAPRSRSPRSRSGRGAWPRSRSAEEAPAEEPVAEEARRRGARRGGGSGRGAGRRGGTRRGARRRGGSRRGARRRGSTRRGAGRRGRARRRAERRAAPAAPAPQSGPKPKRKRLPRALRPKKGRVQREKATERKPITRIPKPEREFGRRQERQGTVVSDKGDKTIVVKVDTIKAHPRYKKVVRRSKRFHAHDEQNAAKIGDVVKIIETRPISKTKNWRLAEIVEVAK